MKFKSVLLSLALGLLVCAGLFVGLNVNAGAASANSAADIAAPGEAAAIRAQDAISTAYVVVRFGDHDAIVRPVTFTQPISAYRALELSGLEFTTTTTEYGLQLCSIEEVGDSSGACDNDDRYWSTHAWNSEREAWDFRMVGIGGAMISEAGHVEGFSWSDPSWLSVDPPPAPVFEAAWQAFGWLAGEQQTDGSYGSAGNTAEVLMALGANRMEGADWSPDGGPSVLDAMARQASTLAASAGGSGKLALALPPQETCWPFTAMRPMAYYSTTSGAFDAGAALHALAMLGTASLSETVPATATDYLLDLQQPNGGWEWGAGWGADTNSTALALQALLATGAAPTSTAVISGLTYLEGAQNVDGGFPYAPGPESASDTNSTAYVLQALRAAGEDPRSEKWSTPGLTGTMMMSSTMIFSGANPIAFLLGMQLSDGSFEWQSGTGANQMATQQATTALLYRPFPIRPAALELCPAKIFLPLVSRD